MLSARSLGGQEQADHGDQQRCPIAHPHDTSLLIDFGGMSNGTGSSADLGLLLSWVFPAGCGSTQVGRAGMDFPVTNWPHEGVRGLLRRNRQTTNGCRDLGVRGNPLIAPLFIDHAFS